LCHCHRIHNLKTGFSHIWPYLLCFSFLLPYISGSICNCILELEHLIFSLDYISLRWNDEVVKSESWFLIHHWCRWRTRWWDIADTIHFFYFRLTSLIWINCRQKEVTHAWFFSSRTSFAFLVLNLSMSRCFLNSCRVVILRSSGPSSVEYTIMTLHSLVQNILIVIFHFY